MNMNKENELLQNLNKLHTTEMGEFRRMKQMQERPALNKQLNSTTFRNFYWLKEELVEFTKIDNK